MRYRTGMAAAFALLAAVAMVMIAGSASAQTLAGTKHDLSTAGTGNAAFEKLGGTDYLCKPCHAPHKTTAAADVPLPNHTLSSFAYATYTTAGLGSSWSPTTIDLVCLGCHDGTVAVDAWSGSAGTVSMVATGGDGSTTVNTTAFLGTDLSGSHPTSVPLPTGTGWNTPVDTKTFGGDVKCASCHNPHGNVTGGAFFLRELPATLCQDCHDK